MSLPTILDLLTEADIQVIDASSNPAKFKETSETIHGFLKSAVDAEAYKGFSVYPLFINRNPEPEFTAVYQPVKMQLLESDGHQIGKIDSYVVSIRAKGFAGVSGISLSIVDAAAAQDGLDIRDAAADYEPDQKQCRAHLQIDALALPESITAAESAFVYEQDSLAAENQLDNAVHQFITERIAIVLVAEQGAIRSLRDRVSAAILGKSCDEYAEPYLYVSGQPVDAFGGIFFWKEVYSYRRYVRSPC